MRRFSLFIISLLAIFNAGGAERSQEQLMSIAKSVLTSKLGLSPTSTRSGESIQMLYEDAELSVAGCPDGGFVVLAKDDAFSPVLGYSQYGFDTNSDNPGFNMWMKATAHALATRSTSIQPVMPEGLPAEVPSYITSKWNQDAPYNLLCPSYMSKGKEKHYPSGCVATAMAQAMYYYKYPDKGTGKHTYRFDPGTGIEETVSVQLDDYPFDWANMTDHYKSDYTDAQAKAVAELMMVCGASVDMQYTASGSGAMAVAATRALRDNFGFDAGLSYHATILESSEEYYPALYRAIAAKMPIIYNGKEENTEDGHCFILDGYDEEGLVSVNWGWGGSQDGMFNIMTLNGFTEYQGFTPVTNQGVYPQYSSKIAIEEGGVDFTKVDDTHIKVTSTNLPINADGDAYNGNLYVVAKNLSSGESKGIATFELKSSVPAGYYATQTNLSKPYITIVNKLSDGDYRLFLASKSEKETDFSPIRTTDDYANSALMTIKDGVITSFAADSQAGWMATTTGISSVTSTPAIKKSGKMYNLNGQQVDASYRGIVIKDGKKMVLK